MPRPSAIQLAVLLSLVASTASAQSAFKCPRGSQMAGATPPDGNEAWCEAKDLFGGQSKSGPYRRWHPNGQLAMEGEFMDGKRHGQWRSYTANGTLTLEEDYKFGKLLQSKRHREATTSPPPAPPPSSGDTSRAAPSAERESPPEETEAAEPFEPIESPGGWFAEEDLQPRPFVYSAWGPRAGSTQLGLGLRMIGYLPSLDFNLVHAFHEHAHLELRIASLGLITVGDLGMRFRFAGDQSFSAALRMNMTTLAVLEFYGGSGMTLGPMPGLVLSMGGKKFQFTINFDVPMWVFATAGAYGIGSVSGTLFAMFLRPSLGFETAIERNVSIYVRLEALLGPVAGTNSGIGVLPMLAVGAAF